jgi:FAD:protein FMN transferase
MTRGPNRASWRAQIGDCGRLLLALWFFPWLLVPHPASALECESDGRYVMGTVLEITLCEEYAVPLRQYLDPLFAKALYLDGVLTTYNPNSPVSRLNAHAGKGPFLVPQEVSDLLTLSLRHTHLTQGTFDVTVGPLMTVWRHAAQRQTVPSRKELQRTRRAVGSDKIRFLSNRTVVLRPGMTIDFGGVGKGYALDQLQTQLKEQHIQHALLDFGQSSLWALGSPPDATGWRIVVQQPDGNPAGVLILRNQALSVSASLGQTVEIGKQQYGHIIDPRTGHPLQRDVLACVIAPTATQAEALSKALLILGEHKGIALLQHFPGVEGLLLETGGSSRMTPGWQQAVAFSSYEPPPLGSLQLPFLNSQTFDPYLERRIPPGFFRESQGVEGCSFGLARISEQPNTIQDLQYAPSRY